VKLVYAGCLPEVASQLQKHGAFSGDHVRSFPTLHRALDWCESVVIARARRNLDRAGVASPLSSFAPPLALSVSGASASLAAPLLAPLAVLPSAGAAAVFPSPASPGSTLLAAQQQSVIKVRHGFEITRTRERALGSNAAHFVLSSFL